MLNHFTTYRIAVEFHRGCRVTVLPDYLKDQILRASSSIALNLAEGSGVQPVKIRLGFIIWQWALCGSVRLFWIYQCELILSWQKLQMY